MTEPVDISIYFQPIPELVKDGLEEESNSVFAKNIDGYFTSFPDWTDAKLVILGVCEGRVGGKNEGASNAPDQIREKLYRLFKVPAAGKIVDLGNIKEGHSVNDTYYALSSVLEELNKKKIVSIVLGGSQDLTFPIYTSFAKLEQLVNLVTIDNSFDLGVHVLDSNTIHSKSYIGNIITHQPSFLFNFSNLGYQTYFADPQEIDLLDKLFFDHYRLGLVQQSIENTEPIIRNADIVSFDVSAIRASDAPGNYYASPNGLYGEEACHLSRYAGYSDRVSVFGLFELNPIFDRNTQTAHLLAQIIWYFIDGFANRKNDFPSSIDDNYVKYRVAIEGDAKHEITFLKSKKTDRWWMHVPYPPTKGIKFERHTWVPCSYEDYTLACGGEMPDKWWQTYQKLI